MNEICEKLMSADWGKFADASPAHSMALLLTVREFKTQESKLNSERCRGPQTRVLG